MITLKEKEKYFSVEAHQGEIYAVAATPDSKYAITGSLDLLIKVWDIEQQELEFQFAGHANYLWTIIVSPDGKHIVSGSADTSIKVWNIEERTRIQPLWERWLR